MWGQRLDPTICEAIACTISLNRTYTCPTIKVLILVQYVLLGQKILEYGWFC